MRCPECSGRELRVGVTLTGTMTCRVGPDEPLQVLQAGAFDSSWSPVASCACTACGWDGLVSEAAETEADLGEISQIRPSEYCVIEDELAAGHCPPHLAPHIERLLDSVHRLNALLEVSRRAQKQAVRERAGSPDDTAIF